MKEVVKISGLTEDLKPKELLSAAGVHIGAGLAGFIAARAVVLNSFLPFGLSFVAGCPMMFAPATAIGVFFGYFIPAAGNGAFRYIAAVFAILAIKFLLANYTEIVKKPIFLSSICLLANFLTAAVTFRGMSVSFMQMIVEALLSAGGTYFVSKAFKSISTEKAGFGTEELTGILIVISMILMGVSGISLNGISLGRILGVFLILTAAKYGGTLAGAISGIVISFSLALSGSPGGISSTYAFGGLMAGVFSSLGKYAQIAAIVLSGFVGAMSWDISSTAIAVILELCIGSVLFLLLPRSLGIHLGKAFSSYPKIVIPDGIKKAMTMRLNLASNALQDVSETVEQVSKELSKINTPDFGTVIKKIEIDACSGCRLRAHCWGSKREDTVTAILEMTKSVKQGDYSPENTTTQEFKGRCMKITSVGNAVYKNYSDYASKIVAENRIEEVRSVVSDQFNGISAMLTDLARDFENDEQFDNSAAISVTAALKNIDIRADECSTRVDKYGRMTIEIKLKRTEELIINKMNIMKLLSHVCERDFDIPNVSKVGGDVFITICEKAALSVDIGVEQIGTSKSSMCGDAYNYFYDGKGHFIMVLSDGMGTGGRAAVDGAMASGLISRLIKAGFGYDCSLRILNSSMLFKSTDESLATVDIASIDIFTGQTELYKAGAAPTLVRRSGRTGKAESTSLPAGILRQIGFDKALIKMKFGDIILIMSDGAVNEGTDWIRTELEAWQDGTAQSLAEHICQSAKRRRTDNHEDDITVMAAIVDKAV